MKNNTKIITLEEIAEKIGVAVLDWPGKCYGIAMLCLEKGVIAGKLRYGHYRGTVEKASIFYDRSRIGFVQHGWIELDNGQVWDPTRWTFDNKGPYMFIGSNDVYDIGGNIARQRFRLPAPKFDISKKRVGIDVDDVTLSIMHGLLEDGRSGKEFTVEQICWVASDDPNKFGSCARTLFEALAKEKLDAFVPIDNWRLVMEN